MDLTALQALPRLSSLSVGGYSVVHGLDNLACLTHLEIGSSEARSEATAVLVSNLKSLSVPDSIFEVHHMGMSACSALQNLQLEGAYLGAHGRLTYLGHDRL